MEQYFNEVVIMNEEYYKRQIKGLMLIMNDYCTGEKDFMISREYVFEKLNMILKGGINFHPVIEDHLGEIPMKKIDEYEIGQTLEEGTIPADTPLGRLLKSPMALVAIGYTIQDSEGTQAELKFKDKSFIEEEDENDDEWDSMFDSDDEDE